MSESPATVGIRDATDADLDAIAALLNEQIAASPFNYAEAPVTIEDRRAWLNTHRAAGLPVLVATLTADHAPPLAGWAALSPYRPSSGYRFTAEASVYVDSTAQRRGVASRLMAELERRATAIELHAVIASIDSENAPSIALFERLGFTECARLPEVGRKLGQWRTQLLYHRLLGR